MKSGFVFSFFSPNVSALLSYEYENSYFLLDLRNQFTILEVKVCDDYGTTIDVVLINGVLQEGHKIVVCGLQASI